MKWREFCDCIEAVFTKKGLEKQIDMVMDDVRTMTIYGRTKPNKVERNQSEDIVYRFKQMLLKNRLDAKSFF